MSIKDWPELQLDLPWWAYVAMAIGGCIIWSIYVKWKYGSLTE